jgi:hypothetical protein
MDEPSLRVLEDGRSKGGHWAVVAVRMDMVGRGSFLTGLTGLTRFLSDFF